MTGITNNRTPTILCVGDLVWDVLTKPDNSLLPGGDTMGRIALAPGGSAANTAVWVARTGMPAAFVGKVGADVLGERLAADMYAERVTNYMSIDHEHDTGVILVLVDQSGQRSTVINGGADYYLLPEDLPVAALEACEFLHVTAWSLFADPPREAAVRAAQIAKAAGATISFDPASYQIIQRIGVAQFDTLTADLPVDIFFPNRDEGATLTGESEPARIAHALRQRYNGALIVLKLDHDGCYVLSGDYERHHPTSAGTVVDTTGAGDSFAAAFLASYARDGDLDHAAQFANAVGRWVVGRFGARPPLDTEFAAILAQSRF